MRMSGRSRGMVFLVAGIALTASAQLNPTVAVLPKAALPVPLECEQGLAPQKMARLDVSQIPEPQISAAANVAPPSVTLRDALRSAQTAAEHNDRGGFTDALAHARALVESYPPGSERDTSADVVKVFNDVDRVWSYQFDSPTGAFFDASSPLLAMLRTYAGYDAFVAENVITTGGTKLYPSHESRMFLLRESARRLARLGVRGGVQVTERPGTDVDRPAHALPPVIARKPAAQQHVQHTEKTQHTKSSSTKSSSTKSSRTKTSVTQTPSGKAHAAKTASTATTPPRHHEKSARTTKAAPKHVPRPEPVKVADATAPKHESSARYDTALTHEGTSPQHQRTQAVPPPVAAPVTTTTPSGSIPTTTHSTTSSAPATTTTAPSSANPVTTTTAPVTSTTASSPTSTTASTTTAPETTTSATASPATSETTATTSTAPTPAQPNRTRNVVLPIILILLGVGVLVVLFRASN